LDIAYFNLKPGTGTNSTSFGINNYSVPIRAANYITSVPPMSASSAFNSTGAERFALSQAHWISAEASAANGSFLSFSDASISTTAKASTFTLRAFRRVPV
jgi:hypothetical protein